MYIINSKGLNQSWAHIFRFCVGFTICISSMAQPADVSLPDSLIQITSIQWMDDGQLKLSWRNDRTKRYAVLERERLDQGDWKKMVDLEPIDDSIYTYGLPINTGVASRFFLVQEIPDLLASMRILHLDDGHSMEFIRIPSGSFTMGSPLTETHRESDEYPLTPVTISKPFLLGKYEVTQAQWKTVMGTNPSRFKADHLPVERISWNLATDFCKRLTELERSAGRLPEDYQYTLPTEAQREYACRAGTQTRFSFGDDSGYGHLPQYAWYWTNSGSKTHPVGEKEPNPWGLYDMHGNVWEWCMDYYANTYPGESVIDPLGPSSGAVRVIRGGGWEDFARDCRSASRMRTWPGNSFSYLGFRVALVENQKPESGDAF